MQIAQQRWWQTPWNLCSKGLCYFRKW